MTRRRKYKAIHSVINIASVVLILLGIHGLYVASLDNLALTMAVESLDCYFLTLCIGNPFSQMIEWMSAISVLSWIGPALVVIGGTVLIWNGGSLVSWILDW